MKEPNRWLKRIWFVNGIFILILSLVVTIGLGIEFIDSIIFWNQDRSIPGIAPSSGSGDVPETFRAVRYTQPNNIAGSTTQIVHVYAGEDFYASYAQSSIGDVYRAPSGRGYMANVVIIREDGSTSLVFDRAALVDTVLYSAYDDRPLPWIAYVAITDDTNASGALDYRDRRDLYVTDVQGNDRHRVLDDAYDIESVHVAADGQRMLVYAFDLARPGIKPEQRPQRAFLYDPSNRELVPFEGLNAAVGLAEQILGR